MDRMFASKILMVNQWRDSNKNVWPKFAAHARLRCRQSLEGDASSSIVVVYGNIAMSTKRLPFFRLPFIVHVTHVCLCAERFACPFAARKHRVFTVHLPNNSSCIKFWAYHRYARLFVYETCNAVLASWRAPHSVDGICMLALVRVDVNPGNSWKTNMMIWNTELHSQPRKDYVNAIPQKWWQ